ncbi:uncharacterized protein LOC127847170 isoform X2 [Dreissena polymorpha]|uniref:uncharacterized protein LOC127847170 isoform X2 n=1 Tax=Dreissena polymorpha TaxID=45954 RepID=UPI0022647711|nr:uncharacterized protein LOC127847170 isoform X2 [Dreissena polymorpha]
MTLDLQRLQIDVPVEPLKTADVGQPVEPLKTAAVGQPVEHLKTAAVGEPTKKRPKSSCDSLKNNSKQTKKQKKAIEETVVSAAPFSEAISNPTQNPLVEQAMLILQKRRAQTQSPHPIAALSTSCSPTIQTPAMHESQTYHVLQNQNQTPFPVISSPLPSWSTSYHEYSDPSPQQWQYDEPVINQHVSGSYLSMLNSSFETEQTETRCQDSTVERLERRIAELESQVKDLQQERHKTSVTPPRMPQMPKSLQNFSNTMQKATLPTNGSMQTNRSSLQTNGSPANGSPAKGSSAHGSSAHIIESAIGFERRMPKALAKAMRAVFTEEQLATCSFKGGITTNGDPRVGLPEAEREAVIDVMSHKFEVDRSVIETKMRSALRRLFVMLR